MKSIRFVFLIFSCFFAAVLPVRVLAVSTFPKSIILRDHNKAAKLDAFTYFVDRPRQLTASDIAGRQADGEIIRPNHRAMAFGYTDPLCLLILAN